MQKGHRVILDREARREVEQKSVDPRFLGFNLFYVERLAGLALRDLHALVHSFLECWFYLETTWKPQPQKSVKVKNFSPTPPKPPYTQGLASSTKLQQPRTALATVVVLC